MHIFITDYRCHLIGSTIAIELIIKSLMLIFKLGARREQARYKRIQSKINAKQNEQE